MQNNYAQWHVERSSARKVNSISEERNKELTTKVNKLVILIKGKEEAQVHAITNTELEDVYFIARNPYNPAYKSPNYGSNFSKQYPKPATGPPNDNNMGANNVNLYALENTFKDLCKLKMSRLIF
jgi:signal peptidase I